MATIIVFRSKEERNKERVGKLLEQALEFWGLGPEFTERAKKEISRITSTLERDFEYTAPLDGSFTPEQRESITKFAQDMLAEYQKVALSLQTELIWCKLYELKREFENQPA